jgi:predicted Zn-dependent protease
MGLATLAVAGSNASYGRKQETEADLYGLQLMMNAGYQPTEAVQLWRYLDAEYTADKSKSKRSGFWASHPKIGDRIAQLEQRSTDTAIEGVVAREAYIAQVSAHYKKFMHNHLQMQEHEQTEQLLKKHLTLGYSPAEIHYFYGELYRTRNNTDDRAKAIEAYSKAIAVDEKLAIAYKELGYLYLKNKNNDAAKFHLTRYLEQAPETSDRAMIEYYLNMLRNSDE